MNIRGALAAGVLALLASYFVLELRAVGINPPAPVGPAGIALLDVGKVLESNTRLQQQLSQLNIEVRKSEDDLRAAQAEIGGLAERSRGLSPGSTERQQLEENMLRRQGEVEAQFNLKRRGYYELESQIYCAMATEMNDVVRRYADQHGIRLVLRINNSPVDAHNRESVLSNINKEVVFGREVDITAEIITELNHGSAQR